MIEKKFIWLLDSGVSRTNKPLMKGQEHLVSEYGEAVVAEWVKTGAAKYAKEKEIKPKEI